jgi:hypothetical protein
MGFSPFNELDEFLFSAGHLRRPVSGRQGVLHSLRPPTMALASERWEVGDLSAELGQRHAGILNLCYQNRSK